MDELSPPDDAPRPESQRGLRGFTMTSARRRRDRRWLWTLAVVAGVVAATLVISLLRPEPEPPAPRTAPLVSASPAIAAPTAAPSPSPSPTEAPLFLELESEAVTVVPASPTATPWVPEPSSPRSPSRRRTPEQPRRLADCLSVSWSYGQASLRPPQVLIDLAARNGCGRDLEASEVWFRVSGWREGDLVQTATGHLFSTLYEGSIGYTGIGLPGSQDWYDRITVEVLEGAP